MPRSNSSREINLEAIILAGGLGTRLRSVVSDVPKPMAPVAGKPFLDYLIRYLIKQGVSRIILSVGYKGDIIIEYFQSNPCGVELSFAFEKEPLGTGGAIMNGVKMCQGESCLVLNGDTFFTMDYLTFSENHKENRASISMALRHLIGHNSRYGKAILEGERVVRFDSSSESECGWINAGSYLINRELLYCFDLPEKFSFEQDFIEKNIQKLNLFGYKSDATFFDIGVPDDYHEAAIFLKKFCNIMNG